MHCSFSPAVPAGRSRTRASLVGDRARPVAVAVERVMAGCLMRRGLRYRLSAAVRRFRRGRSRCLRGAFVVAGELMTTAHRCTEWTAIAVALRSR